MYRVTVEGVNELLVSIQKMPARLVSHVQNRMASMEAPFLETLKATISHVVYNVYEPQQYQRNFNLLKAASSRVVTRPNGATLELYNDSSKIDYQPRADGSIGPRGGSQPYEVPWQIETGEYPNVGHGWMGYSLPRPAYLLTKHFIEPEFVMQMLGALDDALAE